MKRDRGISLIETIIFIVIMGIILVAMLGTIPLVLKNTLNVQQQSQAVESANQCLEWFLANRYVKGYATLVCPSTPSIVYCNAPPGYTISAQISCLTLYGGANYKQITVTTSGKKTTALSLIVANY